MNVEQDRDRKTQRCATAGNLPRTEPAEPLEQEVGGYSKEAKHVREWQCGSKPPLSAVDERQHKASSEGSKDQSQANAI